MRPQEKQLRQGDDAVKRVLVRGAEISYAERGAGDPILFVHGSLSDFRTWNNQVRFFSQFGRAIACSLRYHYPNTPPADGGDYSPVQHAEDLAQLIRLLGEEAAHVVASSYGAYSCLFLALKHPQRVRTFVLGEPPVLPLLKCTAEGRSVLATFMAEAWEPSKAAIEQGDMEQGVRLFIDGVMGCGQYDKLPAAARASMMANAAAKRAEVTAPTATHFPDFTCPDGRRITVQSLLLTGELSARMFHLITDQLEERLAGSQRAVIPGASHAMHSSNPHIYNQVVSDFLRKHGRR